MTKGNNGLSVSQKIIYCVFILVFVVILVFGVLCVVFSHLIEGLIILLSSLLIGICISEAIKIDKGKSNTKVKNKKKNKKKKQTRDNLGVAFFKVMGVKCRCGNENVGVNLFGYDSAFSIENEDGIGDVIIFKWSDIVDYDCVNDKEVLIKSEVNGEFVFDFPTVVKAKVFLQYCDKYCH